MEPQESEILDVVQIELDHDEQELLIFFGNRNVKMEFNNEEEVLMTERFLMSPDTWAVFLKGLSTAIREHV